MPTKISRNAYLLPCCLAYIALLISSSIACNSIAINKNSENDSTQSEITAHEALLADEGRWERDPNFLQKNLPVLESTLKKEHSLYEPLNNYAYDVLNDQTTVQSENDLKRLFYKRDALIIPTLHGEIFDPLAVKDPDFFVGDNGKKLQNELQKIGLQSVYAEGMYVSLNASEMLPNAMKKYGSEVFKLYADFLSAFGNAIGGEYPYIDLSGETQMVAIGEQLMTKYPNHEYTKTVRSDFEFALHTLTDIHTVNAPDGGDARQLFYALSTDPYPYMTNFEAHKQFANTYADTKYGKIVKNILQNTSQIKQNETELGNLYLVVLQWNDANNDSDMAYCDDAEALKDSLFLHQGIDVPHVLPIMKDDAMQCAITYRFYPEKAKAEQALKTLQTQTNHKASIIKVQFNPDNDTWEVAAN